MSFLYEGEYVSARYVPKGGDTLFISWNGGIPETDGPPPYLKNRCNAFESWFNKRGHSCVYLGNNRDDRYQNEDTGHILPLVGAIATGYKQVICYGGSMGGFAALAFSKAVGATKVLAFGPQVILPHRIRYVYHQEKHGFKNIYTVEDGLSTTADIFVYYGSYKIDEIAKYDQEAVEVDLAGICQRKGITRFYPHKIDVDTHYIMGELLTQGVLESINDMVIQFTSIDQI